MTFLYNLYNFFINIVHTHTTVLWEIRPLNERPLILTNLICKFRKILFSALIHSK